MGVGDEVVTDEDDGRFTRASRHLEFLSMSQLQPDQKIKRLIMKCFYGLAQNPNRHYLTLQHMRGKYETLDIYPLLMDFPQYLYNLPDG